MNTSCCHIMYGLQLAYYLVHLHIFAINRHGLALACLSLNATDNK